MDEKSRDIQSEVEKAAAVAKASIRSMVPYLRRLQRVSKEFGRDVEKSALKTGSAHYESAAETVKEYKRRSEELISFLKSVAKSNASDMGRAFARLRKESRFLTVVLFGRTRAGKSTTMEALTGGDGSSIGVGRQHTTRSTRAYYFPSSEDGGPSRGPCCRVVDTPGIDGYRGEELEAMAENYLERADLVLFVMSDDKIGTGELEKFATILALGKETTVLLNVKANDELIETVALYPAHRGLLYKENEIEGHGRRIAGFLKERCEMSAPKIIPYQARSAYLAGPGARGAKNAAQAQALYDLSCFEKVRKHIEEFIVEKALISRAGAPHDLLLGRIYSLLEELAPFFENIRTSARDLAMVQARFEKGVGRAARDAARRFSSFYARFRSASDAIPSLVDRVIAQGGDGKALESEWKQLTEDSGCADAARWFVQEAAKDFERELSEEARTAEVDFRMSETSGRKKLLDRYKKSKSGAKWKKWWRIASRTAAGSGTGGLTAWALGNFWNPTGWLAGGAALALTAGASLASDHFVRKQTDKWALSTKRDLSTRQNQIASELRSILWEDHRRARKTCENWLDATRNAYLKGIGQTLGHAKESSENLERSTGLFAARLEGMAEQIREEREKRIRDLRKKAGPRRPGGMRGDVSALGTAPAL